MKTPVSAFDKAVKYLTSAPRTRAEVKRYLYGKGYTKAEVEEAAERLISYKYIDDAEYCRMYAEYNRVKKGFGLIKRELSEKGVAEDVIADAFADIDTNQSGDVAALAARYLSGKPEGADAKRKLFGYLLNKGFSPEQIKGALREYDRD